MTETETRRDRTPAQTDIRYQELRRELYATNPAMAQELDRLIGEKLSHQEDELVATRRKLKKARNLARRRVQLLEAEKQALVDRLLEVHDAVSSIVDARWAPEMSVPYGIHVAATIDEREPPLHSVLWGTGMAVRLREARMTPADSQFAECGAAKLDR